MTTIQGARACVEAIEALRRKPLEVLSIQERLAGR